MLRPLSRGRAQGSRKHLRLRQNMIFQKRSTYIAFCCGHIEALGSGRRAVSSPANRSRIPINIIASPLYIYHVRMYPVWPIVDVEGVIARLKQDQNPDDENIQEVYALATAVAAATIAQLRLGQNTNASSGANGAEKPVTADTFAAESLRARNSSGYRAKVNLNNVRTSFFLHVYYENQCSGGSESLLYLREAISLAQMMQLHRESSYARLLPEEQQIRRRVLWLLFVTERYFSTQFSCAEREIERALTRM